MLALSPLAMNFLGRWLDELSYELHRATLGIYLLNVLTVPPRTRSGVRVFDVVHIDGPHRNKSKVWPTRH